VFSVCFLCNFNKLLNSHIIRGMNIANYYKFKNKQYSVSDDLNLIKLVSGGLVKRSYLINDKLIGEEKK